MNRPASRSGDPNAERIARMEALIERSSLGTDGARALRNRTSQQTTNRIRRRLIELDRQAALGAVVIEDLKSPLPPDHQVVDISRVNPSAVINFDESPNRDKAVQPHSSPHIGVAQDVETFPRSHTHSAYLGARLYSAPNLAIPAIWYHFDNDARPGSEMEARRTFEIKSGDTRRYIRSSLDEYIRLLSSNVPFSSHYSKCRDILESSTRILSMRLTSGHAPDLALEADGCASETAACISLLLFIDGLDEFPRASGHAGRKAGTPHLGRWIEEQRAAMLRTPHTPILPDAIASSRDPDGRDCAHIIQAKGWQGYFAEEVNVFHKISVILNEANIEHSKSILESSLSSRAYNMGPEERLTLNVDLKFGDDPKPVGSKLSRNALNRLLTLMVKHWSGPSEPDKELTLHNSRRFRQEEMLMIISRSEHDGFLLSAFGAIDGTHTRDIERSFESSPNELRHVAEAFASELDNPDDDSGAPTTIVVIDGIDTESPLIRVDGYLTAQGHVG